MLHSAGEQCTANLKQHEVVPDDGSVWPRHVVLTETSERWQCEECTQPLKYYIKVTKIRLKRNNKLKIYDISPSKLKNLNSLYQ